jgi:pilus assembly protein CpaE
MADKIKVLIVDDIPETRENIRKLLQFDVSIDVIGFASSGKEGVEKALSLKPHVVLMDINMPDIDGIRATEQIREKDATIQVIILSVQNEADYMRRAMFAGVRGFLPKPPNIDELTNVIHKAGEISIEERQKKDAEKEVLTQFGLTGKLSLGEKANIVTVYGAKGGVGRSSVAANLAIGMNVEPHDVLLIDLNMIYGDIPFLFKEQGKNNITNLADQSANLDDDVVQGVIIENIKTGVDILAAPVRQEMAEEMSPQQLTDIIEFLSFRYKTIVIDTETVITDYVLTVFDMSDVVVLLTTQDIPCIKNTRLFLDLAIALGISRNLFSLVMNRYDRRRNISPERVAANFKMDMVAVLPMDDKTVLPSIDRGEPYMVSSSDSLIGNAIKELVSEINKKLDTLKNNNEEN